MIAECTSQVNKIEKVQKLKRIQSYLFTSLFFFTYSIIEVSLCVLFVHYIVFIVCVYAHIPTFFLNTLKKDIKKKKNVYVCIHKLNTIYRIYPAISITFYKNYLKK